MSPTLQYILVGFVSRHGDVLPAITTQVQKVEATWFAIAEDGSVQRKIVNPKMVGALEAAQAAGHQTVYQGRSSVWSA